jgi:hypothetical protein
LEKGGGHHQEPEELGTSVPPMKKRIPWKVVKNYSLSHDIFCFPRSA